MTEAEAYAAALIDGEGSIQVSHAWGDNYSLRVYMRMSDAPPIKFMYDTFGGRYRQSCMLLPSGKWVHDWSVSGQQAKDCLIRVKPYILGKMTQVEIALAFPLESYEGVKEIRKVFWSAMKDSRRNIEFLPKLNL